MDPEIARAGFVLVGGNSSRMGHDKASLPYRGKTLVEHVAVAVAEAAGSVTLVGAPERYPNSILPRIADSRSGSGPLAGIHSALSASRAAWNLIVACDMPGVSGPFLSSLFEAAERSGYDCLIPSGPSGLPEPLCAVYHASCLGPVGEALDRNVRKILEGLAGVRIGTWKVPESHWFRNANTPEEWIQYSHG
jgi:molybdopterin-guanine dinucleotide biosynthesis protein A